MNERRQHPREEPDPDGVARIDWNDSLPFAPSGVGLLLDESPGGLQIVCRPPRNEPEVGQKILFKIDDRAVEHGDIRWISTIDLDLLRIGIKRH